MGTVLLVQVAPEVETQLRALPETAQLVFEPALTLDEGLSRLASGPDTVDAVVLGPEVEAPIQVVQRAYAADPHMAVLILCLPDRCATLTRAVQFAPFLGSDVAVLPVGAMGEVGARLCQAMIATPAQRRHEATIAALNVQLGHQRPYQPAVTEHVGRLLDFMPLGVAVMDDQDTILAWNREAGRVFHLTESQVLGRAVTSLLPDTQRDRWSKALAGLRAGVETTGGLELTLAAADSDPCYLEVTLTPLVGRTGRAGYMALFRDISDRVLAERARLQAEAERTRLIADLQQALDVRTEFLSVASHELRTPLTALGLHVETLLRLTETIGADPRLGTKLRSVDRQVGRLTTLINDLLDVSRFTSGRLAFEPEPLDLAALAAEVVEQFREEALRAGIALTLDTSPAPGRWDRSRLDQVLTNLLTNAIKFGAGRPIEVTVRGRADTVQLTVTDHGIGIAPDDQSIIFDRFERAVSARNYGGFGLGLWIVHQIVTAKGGTITVDSVVGQGSTFTVTLPQQPPEAIAPTA